MSGVDAVLALLAGVGRGDVDAMAEHWTDDFVLEFPYSDPPRVVQGKEAARSYLGGALGTFELSVTVTAVYECHDPEVVVAEYVSEGHVTTTGKSYANRYIAVFTMRDGKIAGQREFYNPLPANAVTGAVTQRSSDSAQQ